MADQSTNGHSTNGHADDKKLKQFNYDFSGKRALVTGAARGIGRGIAIALSECGAETYALSKTQENLDKLVAEYPSIKPVCVDLADWSATRKAVEALPPIDLLVNNAAVLYNATFLDVDEKMMDSVVDVNLKGVINVSQVVAKSLIARGCPGSIVNISSIVAFATLPTICAYSLTKGALTMLTKHMAVELGPHQIRVNSIHPTGILTDMGQSAFHNDILKKSLVARTPLGRFGVVSDIVGPTLHFLSEDASMVHGAFLLVDGGYTVT